MIPQKQKQKTVIKHSQVTSTSKQMHYQHQKGSSVFQIHEKKECLVVKTKKKELVETSSRRKVAEASGNYQFVTTFFSDKKSPQRKLASAKIANPVELMNGTTMNTSRFLN